MEVASIGGVLELSRLHLVIETAELVLVKFAGVRSREALNLWRHTTLNVLAVNGSTSSLGETLTVEVLRLNLGDVAGVLRDVLSLDVAVRAAEPIVALLRCVGVHNRLVVRVLVRRETVEVTLSVLGLAYTDVDVVVGGLVPSFGDDLVDIASSAAVNFVLLGNVAGVARKVLLVISDLCHLQLQSLKLFEYNSVNRADATGDGPTSFSQAT